MKRYNRLIPDMVIADPWALLGFLKINLLLIVINNKLTSNGYVERPQEI